MTNQIAHTKRDDEHLRVLLRIAEALEAIKDSLSNIERANTPLSEEDWRRLGARK